MSTAFLRMPRLALAAALLASLVATAAAQNADALLTKGEEFYVKRSHDASWAARAAEIWAQGEKQHPDIPAFVERQTRAWHYLSRYAADARTRSAAASRGAACAARLTATSDKSAAVPFWSAVFAFEAIEGGDALTALSRLSSIRELLEKARTTDAAYEFGGPDRYLGRLYLEPPLRDPSAAVRHLEAARDAAASYSPNLLALGDAYREAGRAADARAAYEAVGHLAAGEGYETVLARDRDAAKARLQGLAP